jgi:LytS/YehU family sensor histidine kinase
MLYDSNSEKINLATEIEYLQNYVNLQLLRFGDTVRFNLFLSGNAQGYAIEPMLLIPFVENAFKHGIEQVSDPVIEVAIDINHNENILLLKVTNSISPAKRKQSNDSGIGLMNVRRRLDLLYPGNHIITVNEENGLYSVNLEINL